MGYKGFKKLFFLAEGSLAPPNPGRWRCQSDAWPFSWALGGKSCLMSPQKNIPWGYLFRNVNVLRIYWPLWPLTQAPLGFPIKHPIRRSTSSSVPLPSV